MRSGLMRRMNRSSTGNRSQNHWNRRGARWLAIAVAPLAAAFWTDFSAGQSLTFDAGGASPTAPVDGSDNWDTTTTANWSNGVTDSTWINGSTAVFGSGGNAGTVTIDDPSGSVTAGGVTFNSTNGDYTIPGGALNLAGSA